MAAGYTRYSLRTSLKMAGIAINNLEVLESGEDNNSECIGLKLFNSCICANDRPVVIFMAVIKLEC